MGTHKRIGILTSGGDCPGLNAVIRSVVSHATQSYGWEVLGIPYATQGLLEGKSIALNTHGLDLRGIDPLLSMGGTILGTVNKGNTLNQSEKIIANYHALGLDALIGVGGDGSLAILHELACRGNWNFIGIPKTIDNDVALTERAIGFDTAVNTITDALNRLTYTACSHDRVMVVEVMGRRAGHLALHSGIAGGADVILIPELSYSIKDICKQLAELRDRWGRQFALVVVAEGTQPAITDEMVDGIQCATAPSSASPVCGMGQYIVDQLTTCSANQIEIRLSVLGHIQRGGMPSALDRITAAAFGKAAVDLVMKEQYGQMVAWQSGKVVGVPLEAVLFQSPCFVEPNSYLVQTARALGIYVGHQPI